MPVLAQERILLVGDNERQLHAALSQVLPSAHISATATYFDAIGELAGTSYTSVLAASSPIERRPEPAIRTLREAAGEARLLLFGEPGLEPLARKMLEFGLDDYLVTPVNPVELGQMFGTPPMRLAATSTSDGEQPTTIAPSRIELLGGMPLAEILLDAMLHHPHDASRAALNQLNARLGPATQLAFTSTSVAAPSVPEGQTILSHGVRCEQQPSGTLHLVIPKDEDQTTARHLLAQLAILFGQLMSVEERHNRLQRLAISDDLTGLYNGRYFRIFLSQILQKAMAKKFLVTLLLFDIDNFKSYNDRYGHAVGDEILKQTAKLIRSCCREHDHVARISGDEFGVIFWEKEGPRQPRDPKPGAPASRVPQNIVQILERFQFAIANSDLKLLGAHGKGVLSISGGLAVYPHDAQTADALCAAADSALMFGAKKSGKNSIFLVGAAEPHHPNNP